MAEELDPPLVEDAEEQLDTPVDDAGPDPIADLASKIGWSPKDQWKGDPEKWRPADEFIIAGRDIQQTTSRELRAVREQMERLSGVTETIVRDKVAERDAYWRDQHAKAVEDGDVAAAEKASEERGKIAREASPESRPDPTAAQWVAKNEWFNTDPLAQMRAKEVAERLAKQGLGIAEQLAGAERMARKEFPELFPVAAKPAPGTQTGQGRPASVSNRVKGFADMPAASQEIAKDYQRRHGLKLEDFAKSYWADAAKQRMVG